MLINAQPSVEMAVHSFLSRHTVEANVTDVEKLFRERIRNVEDEELNYQSYLLTVLLSSHVTKANMQR